MQPAFSHSVNCPHLTTFQTQPKIYSNQKIGSWELQSGDMHPRPLWTPSHRPQASGRTTHVTTVKVSCAHTLKQINLNHRTKPFVFMRNQASDLRAGSQGPYAWRS